MCDRIAERSDGIPLYAVETIRTLVDQGRLERSHDGRYRVVDDRPLELSRPRQPHRPHRGSAGRVDARRPHAGAQPLGARHDLHPLGSRRTLRRTRRGGPRRAALRPGPPRRPVRARRPAVAAARGVPVQPGTAADRRLRHALQAGAPVAAHRGCRAPAGLAPGRGRRGRRPRGRPLPGGHARRVARRRRGPGAAPTGLRRLPAGGRPRGAARSHGHGQGGARARRRARDRRRRRRRAPGAGRVHGLWRRRATEASRLGPGGRGRARGVRRRAQRTPVAGDGELDEHGRATKASKQISGKPSRSWRKDRGTAATPRSRSRWPT